MRKHLAWLAPSTVAIGLIIGTFAYLRFTYALPRELPDNIRTEMVKLLQEAQTLSVRQKEISVAFRALATAACAPLPLNKCKIDIERGTVELQPEPVKKETR